MIRDYMIVKRVLRIERASIVDIFVAIPSEKGFRRIEDLLLYQSTGEGVSEKEEPRLDGDVCIIINRSGLDISLIRE